MKRAQLIETLKAHVTPGGELAGEIDHLMGIEEREYKYDELSALIDVLDRAESERFTKLLKEARQALIHLGFYRVMPQDEIENTFTSSGRAPWAFKLKGVPYTTDIVQENWWDADNESVDSNEARQ